MEPSPENFAVKCLASHMQVRNIRKVKINANVTFFIWMLEWMANLTTVLASYFALKLTIFPEYALIWYYVVLPYTYLMNTSHNKRLIIDDGMATVVRNALRPPVDYFKQIIVGFYYRIHMNVVSPRGDENVSKIVKVETSSKITEKHDQKKTSGVYVISSSECSSSFAKDNMPNVPLECASTSKGITYIEEGIKRNFLARQSSESSLVNDSGVFQVEYRFSFRKKILSYMTQNVSSEEVYLHYFVQMIDFEEKVKDKDAFSLHLEIMPHISDKLTPAGKSTMTKVKGKNKVCLDEDKSKDFSMSQPATNVIAILKKNTRGSFSQRMEMRRTMLKDYSDHCNDEKSYQKYLTKLIDFEEGVIEY